jgi:ubiquinone/menaquinone biosynthesis C-methylase UbiE
MFMEEKNDNINSNYERFYSERAGLRVYPTEFVVRTFLASYPGLRFRRPQAGERVLDVAFGDGRNTVLLCDQKLEVAGIEIAQGIVDQTRQRLSGLGCHAELKVGRNSQIPFPDEYFDYVLACHCCYYCDEGETLDDNLAEYARVMRTGAFLVASVACSDSYIFQEAAALDDGTFRIQNDPYGNRAGYRLQAFARRQDVQDYFSPRFENFSLGFADNDYYGIREQVFWVVCQKR